MNNLRKESIVCLGGGVGTVNLVRGLREYFANITVIVSMADDGGSGGRLRRLFSIPPPGDLINCLSALSDAEPVLRQLLTYRFEGDRWGRDDSLGGQKLGNLILVALTKIYGSFDRALDEAMRLFSCHGKILPATRENVSIWAKTVDGMKIIGEETIDRGKYDGKRQLAEVYLEPSQPSSSAEVKSALRQADVIVAGPGDLYTTILPVLLVPDIQKILLGSRAQKIFIINVANKPFETPRYAVSDYVAAVERHLGKFVFDCVVVNTNTKPAIPKNLHYHYVTIDVKLAARKGLRVVKGNLVDEGFPLYHHPKRLATKIVSLIK